MQREVITIDRTGRRFTAAVTNAVIRDASGEPNGVIGAIFDLSDRDAYERDLQAARDYLHTVTESIADGLLVFDADGTVTYANDGARALLAAGDDLVGKAAEATLYGTARSNAGTGLLDQHGPQTADDTFRRADGTEVAVEWTASSLAQTADAPPSDDVGAHIAGSRVVVFRDVTGRRAQQEQLEHEAEGLRWAKRLRAALDEDRFELHAQRIVAIDTGETVDHELLIRLRDEDGQLVPPGLFLPAAEEHGLITDIDCWVTEQAVGLAATGMPVTSTCQRARSVTWTFWPRSGARSNAPTRTPGG